MRLSRSNRYLANEILRNQTFLLSSYIVHSLFGPRAAEGRTHENEALHLPLRSRPWFVGFSPARPRNEWACNAYEWIPQRVADANLNRRLTCRGNFASAPRANTGNRPLPHVPIEPDKSSEVLETDPTTRIPKHG